MDDPHFDFNERDVRWMSCVKRRPRAVLRLAGGDIGLQIVINSGEAAKRALFWRRTKASVYSWGTLTARGIFSLLTVRIFMYCDFVNGLSESCNITSTIT